MASEVAARLETLSNWNGCVLSSVPTPAPSTATARPHTTMEDQTTSSPNTSSPSPSRDMSCTPNRLTMPVPTENTPSSTQ